MSNKFEQAVLEESPEQPSQRPPELRDIVKLLSTAATVPVVDDGDVPRNVQQQIRIVAAEGGTYSLYVYDSSTNAWLSTALSLR